MASDEQRTVTWEEFGLFLRRLRRRRGLSQERLAALLGCHRITVWRMEKGDERPSVLFLRGIERVARIAGLAEHEAHLLAAFIELREAPVGVPVLSDEA